MLVYRMSLGQTMGRPLDSVYDEQEQANQTKSIPPIKFHLYYVSSIHSSPAAVKDWSISVYVDIFS